MIEGIADDLVGITVGGRRRTLPGGENHEQDYCPGDAHNGKYFTPKPASQCGVPVCAGRCRSPFPADYVNFESAGCCYDAKKKENNMGRIQSTVNRLLPASILLASHLAIATDDATIPESAVAMATANLPVGDMSVDAAVSPEDRILRMFSLYMEARSTGMLDEAEVLAKQIVEMSITSYGVQSKRTARALTDLGELQASHGDYTAAMLNLARAIEIIENVEDYLSMDLMNPVKTMADVQMRVGATDLAASNWNRALHISHVNLGPHNVDQIETLLALSRLYDDAGMTKEANRIRKRISFLEARQFEAMGSALLQQQ